MQSLSNVNRACGQMAPSFSSKEPVKGSFSKPNPLFTVLFFATLASATVVDDLKGETSAVEQSHQNALETARKIEFVSIKASLDALQPSPFYGNPAARQLQALSQHDMVDKILQERADRPVISACDALSSKVDSTVSLESFCKKQEYAHARKVHSEICSKYSGYKPKC